MVAVLQRSLRAAVIPCDDASVQLDAVAVRRAQAIIVGALSGEEGSGVRGAMNLLR